MEDKHLNQEYKDILAAKNDQAELKQQERRDNIQTHF